jgi:hypothetical protein
MLTAAAAVLVAELDPIDFYKPAHGAVAAAIAELVAADVHVDSGTVPARLRQGGEWNAATQEAVLSAIAGVSHTGGAPEHARIISDCARRRRLLRVADDIATAACAGVDTSGLIGALVDMGPRTSDTEDDPSLGQFIDTDDPDYDWIVEGLLERGDRVILTGPEGGGKSTLFRQMAVQLGAGVHPFTLEAIDPVRVLVVDLENGRRHVRREFRPLRVKARGAADDNVIVRVRGAGIDLLTPEDRRWLEERVRVAKPDVIFIGPIYKMANGDPNDETTGKPISAALDYLRTQYHCALVIEAHSGHANGSTKRPERPIGWSGWMRWPEFGLYLAQEGQLRHWRGDRDQRDWPSLLKRGGEWPWIAEFRSRDVTFAKVVEEIKRAGEVLSLRELAKRLGGHHTQIARAIEANKGQWEIAVREVENDAEPF